MATLEVHDGRGRVEIVSISRDHTALLGSDPKCDVVIDDPQVLPFHGRLRYKAGKYRAEAFPEANALTINGKKVVAASIQQGDEIKLGSFRIFLVNAEDDVMDADPTREQAPPKANTPRSRPKGPLITAGGPSTASTTARPASPAKPTPPAKPAGPVKRVMNVLMAKDQRPGEERLASSPLVLGLVLALGLLVAVGIGLYSVIARNRAETQFNAAKEAYEGKEWASAIKLYDQFLEYNPREARASKARVSRAMATVRQHLSGTPNWTAALAAEKDAHKKVSGEPAYRDDQMNLAELVLQTATGLAERAKASSDPAMLTEVGNAISLHDQVAGDIALDLRTRSQLPTKLAEARAAVEKTQVRASMIADMDKALKAGSAADVYKTRDALVARYADLASDKDVVDNLTGANQLIQKAVKFDPSARPAETTPHPEPLGPALSLVLRTDTALAPNASGPIVYALAQGMAYALDGQNGAPIWHVPVGLSSPFAPMAIAGPSPSCLVYDARHGELARHDGRTGKLLWRQSTGEPITHPPLVLGNQVAQVTPSGKLLSINLISGALEGTVDLGRPASGTPASDEDGKFFYLAAERDVLFVLAREDLSCTSVEFLGHPAGSVACAPARVGPYLIVPQNNALLDGKWTVYVLMEDGAKIQPMQTVDIKGWTWSTPVSQGKSVWSISDRGAITMFEVGSPESRRPLTPVAFTVPDAQPSGPAYGRARSERELWLSAARAGRFDLAPQLGQIVPTWTIEAAGTALAPIQTADRLGVLTQRYTEKPGVSVSGLNFADKKIVWRTVLGSPWPLEPMPLPGGDGLSILSAEGKIISLPRDKVAAGGFVTMPLPRAGYFYVPPTPLQRLDANGLTVLITSPDADHIYVKEIASSEDFRRVDLPAPLGASPLFWGEDLFAPGLDGRVYLVDPRSGAAKAEPYVPPFERGKPTRWKAPVKLGEDAVILADESGRIRRLAKITEPRLRLAVVGEVVDLKNPILANPATTEQAVIVVTDDGKVRALAARDLSSLGTWNLDAPRILGPMSLAGHAFVMDAAGGVIAFGPDGQKIWSVDLRDAPPLGPPVMKDGDILFLSRDGSLQRRSMSDGSRVDRVDLGLLPASGLMTDGPDVLIPSAPGTYRVLEPEGEKVAQP